jgi:hypothetical protein
MSKPKYLGSKQFNSLLPSETAQRYRVVGLEKQLSSRIITKHGEVNFKTMSLSRAAQLVKQGYPHIEEITKQENYQDESTGN